MASTSKDFNSGFVESLSKTQKRKSIGETAKREKKALAAASPHVNRSKTLVVHPKEIQWPFISEDLNSKLLSKLQGILAVLKNPVGKPLLKDIRQVPKADRKQFRKNFREEESNKLDAKFSDYMSIRSSLAIGVNCVSKQLEKNQLLAVLIDPDVDPPIMTKLLVPMAQTKSVTIVAAKGLESAISTASGISCIALGLKRCCTDEANRLHELVLMLQDNQTTQTSLPEATSNSTPVSDYRPTKIRKLNSL